MTYEGQFDHGEKRGYGKMTLFRPYQVILGTFGSGTQNNVITYANSTYKGQTLDCLPHGFGIKTHVNGDIYKGQFFEGKESGLGTKIWKDKGSYTGLWAFGNPRNSSLVLRFFWSFLSEPFAVVPERITYEGEFLNGLYHGKGVITFEEGKFEGDFKEGMADGKAYVKLTNGDSFEGFLQKNEPTQGKMIFKNVGVYEGLWNEGIPAVDCEFI